MSDSGCISTQWDARPSGFFSEQWGSQAHAVASYNLITLSTVQAHKDGQGGQAYPQAPRRRMPENNCKAGIEKISILDDVEKYAEQEISSKSWDSMYLKLVRLACVGSLVQCVLAFIIFSIAKSA